MATITRKPPATIRDNFTMTRRQLVLAAPAAALAQPQQTQPPLPRTPDEELNAAREQQQRNSRQLAALPIPMSTEPACHFKV